MHLALWAEMREARQEGKKERKKDLRGWDTNPHPLGGIPSALLFKLPGHEARRQGSMRCVAMGRPWCLANEVVRTI
jgi:hypothetical protein